MSKKTYEGRSIFWMTTFCIDFYESYFSTGSTEIIEKSRLRYRGGPRIGRERQRQRGQNQKMRKYRYIDRAIAETKLQHRQRESNSREDIDEDGAETE
jgi:hypothetical protein